MTYSFIHFTGVRQQNLEYVRRAHRRLQSGRRLGRADVRTEQRFYFCELLDSPTRMMRTTSIMKDFLTDLFTYQIVMKPINITKHTAQITVQTQHPSHRCGLRGQTRHGEVIGKVGGGRHQKNRGIKDTIKLRSGTTKKIQQLVPEAGRNPAPNDVPDGIMFMNMSHDIVSFLAALDTDYKHKFSLTLPIYFSYLPTVSPTHTRSMVLDPYLPCDVPRQSGGSTQFPSLTGTELASMDWQCGSVTFMSRRTIDNFVMLVIKLKIASWVWSKWVLSHPTSLV